MGVSSDQLGDKRWMKYERTKARVSDRGGGNHHGCIFQGDTGAVASMAKTYVDGTPPARGSARVRRIRAALIFGVVSPDLEVTRTVEEYVPQICSFCATYNIVPVSKLVDIGQVCMRCEC